MNAINSLKFETINSWASLDGEIVALHLKQKLLPIDGPDGIIFPPTYADIGYSIDTLSDGSKVAQIDSIPSQANRMEPLFLQQKFRHLVPQVEFDLGKTKGEEDSRTVSLLELAHRAGDAVVRSSEFAGEIDEAFKSLKKHNAEPLARLAPTSLLFGAWDSRGTQVKRPRLVRSLIRAENVEELTTSSQFNSVWKLLDDEQKKALADAAKANKVKLSVKGFNDVPSGRRLGGIIAHGPITRQVTINLIALRQLSSSSNEQGETLRRYILGLALLVATADLELYLREGCLLRFDDTEEELWEAIPRRGQPVSYGLSSEINRQTVLDYANQAAQSFGVSQPQKKYLFDIKKAKEILAKKEDKESDAES